MEDSLVLLPGTPIVYFTHSSQSSVGGRALQIQFWLSLFPNWCFCLLLILQSKHVCLVERTSQCGEDITMRRGHHNGDRHAIHSVVLDGSGLFAFVLL